MTTILTPDQRTRVFISSTLKELAPERKAAQEAINQLRMTPIMFELGARTHSPDELYRTYLEQSDIFLGIYWQEYGWIAPDMSISGLEDEYNLSGSKPKLIYLKRPAPNIEPRLSSLLSRIQKDSLSYKPFSTEEELRDLITDDLAQIFTESFETLQVAPVTKVGIKATPNNLPRQSNNLIGREKEIDSICALIHQPDTTIITLTGTGGIGKSRIALQVATNVLEDFKDGVWFVDLSPIIDPNLVVPTIAKVLSVRETAEQTLLERLDEYLRNRHVLLLLDTFEHLLDATSAVDKLLKTAPYLKILVTCLGSIHIYGEHELPIPPLEVPDIKHLPDLHRLAQYEAIRLFVARAQSRKPTFELSSQNGQAVAEICSKLDGIPLAIELAAARIKAMTPQSIAAGMGNRLQILDKGMEGVPERHRTLRATIDWSYNLLNSGEKRLFARMSVFRGGCTLAAADAVGSQVQKKKKEVIDTKHYIKGQTTLDDITSLLDKSLLQQQEGSGGEARYSMLDTIQEYALEKLQKRPEYEDIRRRHAHFYESLVEEAYSHGVENLGVEWLNRLEEDHDNLRVALRWSGEGPDKEPQQYTAGEIIVGERLRLRLYLVIRLSTFWRLRGYISEGRKHFQKMLDKLPDYKTDAWQDFGPGYKRMLSSVLYGTGIFTALQGDLETARSLQEKGIEIDRDLGDKDSIASSLDALANIFEMEGDYIQARSLQMEHLLIRRELGEEQQIAEALNTLGFLSYVAEDYTEAHSLLEETNTMAGNIEGWNDAGYSFNQGMVLLEQGDYEQGRNLLKKSLLGLRDLRDKWRSPISLAGFADLSLRRTSGDRSDIPKAERAARLLGSAKALHEDIGTVLSGMERIITERATDKSKKILGEITWKAAFEDGRSMNIDQAIAYALNENEETGTGT